MICFKSAIYNDFAGPSAYHNYILVSNLNFEVTRRKFVIILYYEKEENKEEIYMIKSIRMFNSENKY